MSDAQLIQILVVEDEEPLLEAIRAKLSQNGFQVTTARTAPEALKALEGGDSIDVIWLDHYLLGKETGLDFLTKLKESEALKMIPVFVVSNTAGPEKQQAYLKLGIHKYFTKSMARLEDIIQDIKKGLNHPESG